MALGMGDGGEQIAPLGQAVIGGLLLSTISSLLVLQHLFVLVRGKATLASNSLDPDDPERIILTKEPVNHLKKRSL